MRYKMTRALLLPSIVMQLFFVSTARCDIFSSTSHLQNLMYLERHMMHKLTDLVSDMEEKLDQVKR